ncbi:hypothetical protein L210DRAFT_3503084 [Boletus edulis BED1]|uniref:Uncharacterized protein n=1 Tax=Boletus edulis BED1 TaxID=1328754 RepID=A0AAD4GGG9_BOLED|nr:hypothetical protein L210DRAFT_3503084 [Boletus edulis BED1]
MSFEIISAEIISADRIWNMHELLQKIVGNISVETLYPQRTRVLHSRHEPLNTQQFELYVTKHSRAFTAEAGIGKWQELIPAGITRATRANDYKLPRDTIRTAHQSHNVSPATAMSDLHARKFLIVLASPSAPPPFPVGANVDEGPVSPVIAGGKDNVWSVRRVENGHYNLTLEQMGPRWLSRGIEDDVVVGLMPLPGEWVITRGEDGTFSSAPILLTFIDDILTLELKYVRIEEPGDIFPTKSWALDSTEPGTRLTRENTYRIRNPIPSSRMNGLTRT